MSELKPCPFCGDTYIIVRSHINYYTVGCNSLSCVCLHTHGKPFKTEEKAIEAWNRRIKDETD